MPLYRRYVTYFCIKAALEDSSNSDDNDNDNDLVVYTADVILRFGLQLVGYTRSRIWRAKKDTNVDQFHGHFGSNPIIYAEIWEDLQTIKVQEARVPPKDLNIIFSPRPCTI
jgi:hypothetical protein